MANLVDLNNSNLFAGRWMVVLYELGSDPLRSLIVYDGLDGVSSSTPQALTMTGFLVPPVFGQIKLGVVGMDGDNISLGDALMVNGSAVSDAQNPANNFFNSTRSHLGVPVSSVGDLPQLTGGPQSMSGLDLDVVDISALTSAGQTSLPVGTTTAGDVYHLTTVIASIDNLAPSFATSTMTATDLNGGNWAPGDVIEYTMTVSNTGNDSAIDTRLSDPLPVGVSYVPGSIEVLSGANAGAKTDAGGDDQAEYDAATRTIQVRLGSGADAVEGGALAVNAATSLRLRATIDRDCAAAATIANQASISASGQGGGGQTTTLSDGNGAVAGSPPTVVSVDARCLTVASSGAGAGSIVSAPTGIQCGAVCSSAFGTGSTPMLTATANAGSVFTGWSGALSGNDNPIAITLADHSSVTANFLFAQTITAFAATPSSPLFVANGSFTVSATGGASGLPVTFATTTPTLCSVNGNTVTMLAVGVCMLTATQGGDAQFAAAPLAHLDVPMLTEGVFLNGFESGSGAIWQVVEDGPAPAAQLSTDPVTALLGSSGLAVGLRGHAGDGIYLQQQPRDAAHRYRAQFRLDPRHARIDSGSLVFAAGVDVGAGIAAFEIGLGQTAGGYVITLVAGENNGRSLTSSVLVPARPILIEIDWSARSSAAQRGHARLLIDGRLVAQLTHLDNDQLSIERLRLGAIAGFGNGNSGRLRLYDFVSVD